MKLGILGKFMMAAVLVVGVAAASGKGTSDVPRTSAELAKSVRHEILMYSNYSLWDDVNFRGQ